MDFVDLMQLPFREALRCKCSVPNQHLVADGITVCCKRSMLHVSGSWLPQDSDVEVAAWQGSAYHERFVLKDRREQRQPLLQFLDARGASDAQHEALLARFEAGSAFHFVLQCEHAGGVIQRNDAGALIAADWARGLLREVATDSPAVATVTIGDTLLVERWLRQVREALDAPDALSARSAISEVEGMAYDAAVRASMPALYPCLRAVRTHAAMQRCAALCEAVCEILEQLVQVRSTKLLCSAFAPCQLRFCFRMAAYLLCARPRKHCCRW